MARFAKVNMAGEIETVVVGGLEWPHLQPGQWVRLDDKRRPTGIYNFDTGEFENDSAIQAN